MAASFNILHKFLCPVASCQVPHAVLARAATWSRAGHSGRYLDSAGRSSLSLLVFLPFPSTRTRLPHLAQPPPTYRIMSKRTHEAMTNGNGNGNGHAEADMTTISDYLLTRLEQVRQALPEYPPNETS